MRLRALVSRFPWHGLGTRCVGMVRAGMVSGAVLLGSPSPPPSPGPISWARCLDQPGEWYASEDAVRIADNVLLYQRRTGGWPKGIDMARRIEADERSRIGADKGLTDSTMDNGATYTEMRYLARVFDATRQERFRAGLVEGLEFLLRAQYANGGWPQSYPLRSDYSRHITFNDGAMTGVMELLRDIAAHRAPWGFLDKPTQARAAQAVERGLRVIIDAQVRVGGRLTAWCAQNDAETLEPRGARSYELPSLSGQETVGIVCFLMTIEPPRSDVTDAIESAVAWLRDVQIKGRRLEKRPDRSAALGYDLVMIEDPAAPPLWARFYEIGTNRPIFSGRDGVVKHDLAEIEYERRTGYSWIGRYAADLLDKAYPKWKRRRGGD